MNKPEPNAIHNALLAAGETVVKAYTVGFSHGYEFTCDCVRVYSVDPITFRESESLIPCKKHKELVR